MEPSVFKALATCAHTLQWPDWRIEEEPTGNLDRRADAARHHAIIRCADGQRFKATFAQDLSGMFENHRALHAKLPLHTPSEGQLVRTEMGEVWIQPAGDFVSFESLLTSFETLPRALVVWQDLLNALEGTHHASCEEAWQVEWTAITQRVRALPLWNAEEQPALGRLLQTMESNLRPSPQSKPTTRWSNGDFTSENVLVPAEGPAWLVDAEHAQATHFGFEDMQRFRSFSHALNQNPSLALALCGKATSVELQFLHLRQLWLETTINSADYQQRVALPRKEALLEGRLEAIVATDPTRRIEPFEQETAQLFFSAPGGWSETHSVRSIYRRGVPQYLCFAIPDATATLRFDPSATSRPLEIRALQTVNTAGLVTDCIPGLRAENCRVQRHVGRGLSITDSSQDPQLLFEPPADAKWLIVDVTTASDLEAFNPRQGSVQS